MKRLVVLILICGLILSLAACVRTEQVPSQLTAPSTQEQNVPSAGTESDTDNMDALTITDDMGRSVAIPEVHRVAVLIGSFADIWCTAGGKDLLVAAPNDTWTSFDLDLDENVQNLGAIKSPSVEVLLASEPDLVIGSMNTQADVDLLPTLEQAGITTIYFDVQRFEDYLRMLDACTQITGQRDRFATYGTELQKEIAAAVVRQNDTHPSVLCIRVTGSSIVVKASQDYLLGEMLLDLGCSNVADSNQGLLENLSVEAVMLADPDYIFVVVQGSDPTEANQLLNDTLLSNPAWSTLRAVQEGRYYSLENALYNLKPNARWGEAYEKLADILYPQAS